MTRESRWEETCRRVAKLYPSVADPRFEVHLSEPGTLGAVVRDFLRLDSLNGGGGQRSTPGLEDGLEVLEEMMRGSFSMDANFPTALRALTRGQSHAQIARKAAMSKSAVQRLMAGTASPSPVEMAMLARAYGKKPEWFAAYRAHVLATLVAAEAQQNPERSAELIRQLLS